MKHVTKIVTVLALATPALAHADAPVAGSMSGAVGVHLFPSGEFTLEADGDSESEDLDTAYGIGGQLDYWATPQISIGLAPRLIFNVIPEDADDDDDSASQLDVAVRVQYNHQANPQLTVFGFAAPGFSVIMLPEEAEGIDNPKGFILGFGGGIRYGIGGKTFLQAELGYQLGYHGTEFMDVDLTFATNLLHLGAGVGATF